MKRACIRCGSLQVIHYAADRLCQACRSGPQFTGVESSQVARADAAEDEAIRRFGCLRVLLFEIDQAWERAEAMGRLEGSLRMIP